MSLAAPASASYLGVQVASVASLLSTPSGSAKAQTTITHIIANQVVDAVSLSPEATTQLMVDALDVAIYQIGSLLQKFEQLDRLPHTVAPRALVELAAEIGTAAYALGNGVHMLVPYLEATVPRPIEPVVSALPLGIAESFITAVPNALARQYAFNQSYDQRHANGGQREQDAPAGWDPALTDPCRPTNLVRQLRDAAGSILRNATGTLERMQLRLHEAAASPHYVEVDAGNGAQNAVSHRQFGPAHEAILGEANVALALALVVRAECLVGGSEPDSYRRLPMLGLKNQLGSKISFQTGGLRTCLDFITEALCMVIMLWLMNQMDLGPARIAAAIVAAVGGMSWSWKKIIRRRRLR